MSVQILFLQGAGSGAYDEDKKLVDSLQRILGQSHEIRYPEIPDDGDAPYDQWREQIERELTGMPGPVALAGHSVGASVLIKWVSERQDDRPIAGLFLAACPYWGRDGWRYEGYEELMLAPRFAARLPKDLSVFLYHCRDDETVPFDHLALYARDLPRATVHECENGGHQLNDDLSAMARDIASLRL